MKTKPFYTHRNIRLRQFKKRYPFAILCNDNTMEWKERYSVWLKEHTYGDCVVRIL